MCLRQFTTALWVAFWTGALCTASLGDAREQAIVDGVYTMSMAADALQMPIDAMGDYLDSYEDPETTSLAEQERLLGHLDGAREGFAHMERFLKDLAAKSGAEEIRGFAAKLAKIYGGQKRELDKRIAAVKAGDDEAFSATDLAMNELDERLDEALDQLPELLDLADALMDKGVLPRQLIACPWVEFSKQYYMECIGENELSKTGE